MRTHPIAWTISVSEETEDPRYARQIEHTVPFRLQMYKRRVLWKGIEEKEILASTLRACASETEKVGVQVNVENNQKVNHLY
jgi:hypothetical protein